MKDIKEKFFAPFGIRFNEFMKVDLINMQNTKHLATAKFALYNDPFVGRVDSTIYVELAKNYKKFTRQLTHAVKHTGEYAYIFENLKNLSSLLELKYDLTIQTRTAYLAGDKGKLQEIADKIYPEILKRLNRFYKSMRLL